MEELARQAGWAKKPTQTRPALGRSAKTLATPRRRTQPLYYNFVEALGLFKCRRVAVDRRRGCSTDTAPPATDGRPFVLLPPSSWRSAR